MFGSRAVARRAASPAAIATRAAFHHAFRRTRSEFPGTISSSFNSEHHDQHAGRDGDLIKDLGDVLEILHRPDLHDLFRDDDGIAGLRLGRHEAAAAEYEEAAPG